MNDTLVTVGQGGHPSVCGSIIFHVLHWIRNKLPLSSKFRKRALVYKLPCTPTLYHVPLLYTVNSATEGEFKVYTGMFLYIYCKFYPTCVVASSFPPHSGAASFKHSKRAVYSLQHG